MIGLFRFVADFDRLRNKMIVSEMGYIYWEPGRMQKVSEYVMKSEGAEVLGLLKTRFVEGLNKEKPVCT